MPEEEYARIEEYDRLVRTLAHLAAAWRDYGDFEILASHPDGTVTVDVIAGSARHASAGPLTLRLAADLRAALADRLARKAIDPGGIETAELVLRIDTGAIPTDRARIVHFDFDLEARLRAAGKEYRAARREDHVWHDREPAAP
jgi:hypothetical protein